MKSIKMAVATVTALAGLFFCVHSCHSQLLPGIPSNIEPDRVRPLAKVDLPKVQISPDFVEYFLEPWASDVKPGDSYPLVHLRIPKKPHFPENTTSGPVRTYGQTLDMIWPDLAGLGEPGGAACLERYRNGAGGHCPNLVRVYIDFMWKQEPSLEKGRFENFDRDIRSGFIKSVEEVQLSDLSLVGMMDSQYPSNRNTIYVGKNGNGENWLLFRCAEFADSPACETRFTSSKNENIVVKIRFVYSLLPQWRQVVEAVQAKVGGYIVQTYSLKTKE